MKSFRSGKPDDGTAPGVFAVFGDFVFSVIGEKGMFRVRTAGGEDHRSRRERANGRKGWSWS